MPPRNSTLLILIGQSTAVAFLLRLISGWVFPFTWDSMMCISTAKHIAHFQGMLFNNFFIQPPAMDVLPIFNAPPGYSIAIAILDRLGMNAYTAALVLPRV